MTCRRLSRLLMLVVLAGCAVPATADAGILSWLDKLSGPGPFWGIEASFAVRCFVVGESNQTGQATRPEGSGFVIGCPKSELKQKEFAWFLTIGGAIAEHNPLDYDDLGRTAESTAVRMLKFGTALDYRVFPALEIGSGVGVRYFAGPRFDNFALPYIQPARMTIRPLLWSGNDWLLLSANWDILLGVVDGAKFGAPRDSFRADRENNLEIGVSIDLVRLFNAPLRW